MYFLVLADKMEFVQLQDEKTNLQLDEGGG